MRPEEIERESFAIIERECAERGIAVGERQKPVVYRAIHATADFDYAQSLVFSGGAVEKGIAALRAGADIVTDTNMALAGVNKRTLGALGGSARCFMTDADVAAEAGERGVTRAFVSMERAAAWQRERGRPMLFAIGNAPTALLSISELIGAGFAPALVIGVPVGFVQVVEAKELLMTKAAPYIVSRGRKGGSGVAAAIANALLKLAAQPDGAV